jgi:hypothetical protein
MTHNGPRTIAALFFLAAGWRRVSRQFFAGSARSKKNSLDMNHFFAGSARSKKNSLDMNHFFAGSARSKKNSVNHADSNSRPYKKPMAFYALD